MRSQPLLKEFDQEMVTTRRVIERVPSEQAQWKPHAKSFSIGHLAQLLAWMPGWMTNTMTQTELDVRGGAGYSYETTTDLLALFDRNVAEARAAIAASSDADYDVVWSLKIGGHVVMAMPRSEAVRNHLNHLVHHRGQMTVYLRLIDVPVPMVYGPTADERMPGF